MTDDDLTLLMDQAAQSPYGIELAVSDVEVFKRRFYAARAKAAKIVPELSKLTLRTCPTDPTGKVWLRQEKDQ